MDKTRCQVTNNLLVKVFLKLVPPRPFNIINGKALMKGESDKCRQIPPFTNTIQMGRDTMLLQYAPRAVAWKAWIVTPCQLLTVH